MISVGFHIMDAYELQNKLGKPKLTLATWQSTKADHFLSWLWLYRESQMKSNRILCENQNSSWFITEAWLGSVWISMVLTISGVTVTHLRLCSGKQQIGRWTCGTWISNISRVVIKKREVGKMFCLKKIPQSKELQTELPWARMRWEAFKKKTKMSLKRTDSLIQEATALWWVPDQDT